MPCVLGFNVWKWDGFAAFGGTIMDVEDFLGQQPAAALGFWSFAVLRVRCYGWGWENYKAEANAGPA